MAKRHLHTPGNRGHDSRRQADLQNSRKSPANMQRAYSPSEQDEQDEGVRGILHCVGEGQGSHANRTVERQRHDKIEEHAHNANKHRNLGIFARVERGDEQLIHSHKRQLVGIVLQRQRA